MTQRWVVKALETGLIVERQISPGVKTKLLSFENAVEFIKLIPPIEQKQTKLKFIEMIHRYIGGEHSLVKESCNQAELAGSGQSLKRKHSESEAGGVCSKVGPKQSREKRDAREEDLAFVVRATSSLKDICGGQLDGDAKEALKSRMFKILELV